MTLEAPPGAWCSAGREIARLSRSEKTVWGASERVGKATHARNEHHGRAPEGRAATHGPLPQAPIPTSLSWPPTNSLAPVAQLSDHGVDEHDAGWVSRGPPFPRFAAAMEPLRRHRTKCSLGRGAGSALRIPLIRVPHPMARHRWLGTVLRGALCESALTAGPSQLRAGSDRPTGLRE